MDDVTFGRNGPYGDAWSAALQYSLMSHECVVMIAVCDPFIKDDDDDDILYLRLLYLFSEFAIVPVITALVVTVVIVFIIVAITYAM